MGAPKPKEDVLIPSVCYGCYNACGIRVRRVDGKVVSIEGDPANPGTEGRICAKGKARVMDVYDPNRVLYPLRRRNPEKGIGVDPMWERISWEEALTEIAQRLDAIRKDDPRKLVLAHFDMPAAPLVRVWSTAFGTPHSNWSAAGLFCGMGSHSVNMLVNGAYNSEVDFERCNHLVLFGTQMGFMVDSNATTTTRKAADARKRGMKVTVIDPVLGTAASKADSWIPIRPGTDAAFALAIVHVLINEIGVYDADFLRKRTNSCYLINPDGTYARDPDTAKPLVWNSREERAEPFDICPWQDSSLLGSYTVGGVAVRTAFTALKSHVGNYDPERVSVIVSVPAARIRSLAHSLAADARIGETVTIDGEVLPFRPVAANFKMGAVGHKHGFMTGFAIHLINIVLGAIDVPGSFLGVNPIGPYWEPEVGPDGLLVAADAVRNLFGYNPPFPGAPVRKPESMALQELLPIAVGGRCLYPLALQNPAKFGIPYHAEMLIHSRVNLMMSTVSPPTMAEIIKKIPFMVSFAIQLDETAELADIVLPDKHDLERDDLFPASHHYAFVAPGPGDWYWTLRRAVVPPPGECQHWGEVLLELAHRMGFADEFYETCNALFPLKGEYRLKPDGKYSLAEIGWSQVMSSPVRRPDETPNFDQSSAWNTGHRTLRESYPGPFVKPRFPIYAEHLLHKGREVEETATALQLEDWDTSDYRPLPDWLPSAAHEEPDPRFDLIAVPYKTTFLGLSIGPHNPLLNELAHRHSSAYRLAMHTLAGRARGIKDGDWVVVESAAGRVEGRVRLTQGIQPDTVAIAGISGHWARRAPIARNAGLHFNALVPLDIKIVDKLSSAFDSKVAVRVYKGSAPAAGRERA